MSPICLYSKNNKNTTVDIFGHQLILSTYLLKEVSGKTTQLLLTKQLSRISNNNKLLEKQVFGFYVPYKID